MAYPENMIVPVLGCLESSKLEGRLGPIPGDVFYHISGAVMYHVQSIGLPTLSLSCRNKVTFVIVD